MPRTTVTQSAGHTGPPTAPRGTPLDALADQRGVTLRASFMTRTFAARAGGGGRRRLVATAWIALLLAILAFLVIYPVAMLVIGALTDSNPVVDGLTGLRPSLDNFVTVLRNPNVHAALANSLICCGGRTALPPAVRPPLF